MAEDADTEDEVAEGEEAEGAKKKKLSGKTIILFIALPVLLLVLAGGGAFLFLGSSSDEEAEALAEEEVLEEEKQVVFYDMPEILVNLSSSDKRGSFLKLRVSLELDDPEAPMALEPLLPRVVDNFQVFLREMRVEDLRGSAGMIRLKEELLRRVNISVQPIEVQDILFKEMLVQ